MTETPPTTAACPSCGTELPGAMSAHGLCPRCLLGAGVERPLSHADDAVIGTQVGNYEIIDRIGEGGMGVVYLAEQTEPVRRDVAFKLIKRGMDTEQFIARFEVERQSLARMEHPSIAHVIDAGATEGGRPWYVMELVEGLPLGQFCEREDLGTSERLRLFLKVCAGVQHAHQKGIIHRDLKPSNILVSLADATPKIIDFGLAKATRATSAGDAQLTIAGEVFGTPEYMSPEQAGGERNVDTRTDVYALGKILAEIVSAPESRELGWIAGKACEEEPDDRYQSVSEFATDIRNVLENRPVSATRPSILYVVRKFVRRHRALSIAGLIAMAAVAVGIRQTYVASTSAARAEAAGEQAKREAVRAAYLSKVFAEVFTALQADTSERRREQLFVALNHFKHDHVLDSDPDIEFSARQLLATGFLALGHPDEAEDEMHKAILAARERAGMEDDDPRLRAARSQLARILMADGQHGRAEPILLDLLDYYLAGRDAHPPERVSVLYDLGTLHFETRDFETAERYARESLLHASRLYGAADGRTTDVRFLLAKVLVEKLAYEEARTILENVTRRRLENLGADNAQTVEAKGLLEEVRDVLGKRNAP